MVFLISHLFASPIEGTVLSEEGSAVVDALVYLFDQRSIYEYTRTDTLGNFSFSLEEDNRDAGSYRILVVPSFVDNLVPTFYPETEDYCDGTVFTAGDQVSFTLFEGEQLQGMIETPQGEAAAGAIVQAVPSGNSISRGAISDTQGRFTINGLSPNESIGWNIEVELDEYPDQFLGPAYDDDEAELFLPGDIGQHQLLEGISLLGSIQGPSGPLPQAEIYAYSDSQVVSGYSDDNGEFIIKGLPPGDALLWSAFEGHATTYAPNHDRPTTFYPVLEEGESLADITIDLPLETIFQAQLLDGDSPVLGASILLYNDTSTVGRGAPVDDQGVATVDRLHTGDYTLQIYAENDGYTNFWYSIDDEEKSIIALTEDSLLQIELDPASTLYGTVLDDNGEAVYGADIIAYNDVDTQRGRSDRFGRYQLWGLYEGEWTLEISYLPLCATDISYVPIFYPGTPDALQQQSITIVAGDQNYDLLMPIDKDHDGMSDVWEETHQLDTNRNDSQEDPDLDGLTNIEEYYNNDDPRSIPPSTCACSSGSDALLLFPLLLTWRRRRS